MIPLDRMRARVDRAQQDSDVAYFFDLMYYGEFTLKLLTCAVLAALADDRDRNRYRLEHQLVRADSLGDWAQVLDDALAGPASQQFVDAGHAEQRELAKQWLPTDDVWQSRAVVGLHEVCKVLDPIRGALPAKITMRRWVADFAWLRNRTRGHGAPTAGKCAGACVHLRSSIDEVVASFVAFSRPWAHLHRSLSGKYRVTLLNGDPEPFQRFKRENWHPLPDGVYINYDELCKVPLVATDVDIADFKIANGGFKDARYELLSYITDDRELTDATGYLAPPTALPFSETHGTQELDVQGKSFGNIPPPLPDYVSRQMLEDEVRLVLADSRHPVVTLAGRGGIGKTSLALRVLHDAAGEGQFPTILWFSARDIDLLPQGPKPVRPRVLSVADIAAVYAALLLSVDQRNAKGFRAEEYLSKALGSANGGEATLFVFDNFETVRHPAEVYKWLDTFVRLPNKVLITTRLRDFKGDYPIEVGGMSEPEFQELVTRTSARLGISSVLTAADVARLFDDCDGHPYVAKILLGEVARKGRPVQAERLMAGKDDVLDALFERTYAALVPAAQRVFLTLCNWRSTVPTVALEAALLRPTNEPIDVAGAVEELQLCSLVDVLRSAEDDEFLQVPLAAALFGKRKLITSPMKPAVEADTKILHEFGAGRSTDVARGLEPRVRRLFSHVAARLQAGDGSSLEEFVPILEYIGTRYAPGWLQLADLYEEHVGGQRGHDKAIAALQRYLEARPDDRDGWMRLSALRREVGDDFGALQAQLEMASRGGAPYADVSNAANRLNALLRDGTLKADVTERRMVIERVRDVMVRRIAEANATDCSRLAWLCLHLGDKGGAHAYVGRGLELDPNNQHCLGLAHRLEDD